MSLDQRRCTVQKIAQARELLLEAADEGCIWLDDRTLARIEGAFKDVGWAQHYADQELGKIERSRVQIPNKDG